MAIPDGFKSVSIYLSPELAEAIERYAIENNITRKSKDSHKGIEPSYGTAIVKLLDNLLIKKDDLIAGSNKDGFEERISRLETILNSHLPSTVPSHLPDNSLATEPVSDSHLLGTVLSHLPDKSLEIESSDLGIIEIENNKLTTQSYTYHKFAKYLKLDRPATPRATRVEANNLIATAKEKGKGDWKYNSDEGKFNRQ